MVEESLTPGASVIEIARRHDVHPNLLTVWRRQARTGAFRAAPTLRPEGELQFAAVSVTPEQPAWPVHAGSGGTIEIAFASGVQLRITGAVDPATLTAAVVALSGERAR
jgi:transposase